MAADDKELNLNELRVDPRMWMRLATHDDNSDVLHNVFQKKENPFEKNGDAAMRQIKQLASQGKLFLREEGRSRHFRKVEVDGEKMKLGETQDMRLSNGASSKGLAVLMWLSKKYFNWLGLDGISKWFERRLDARREQLSIQHQYRKEYKEFDANTKKQLKTLRKMEKQEAKLAKLQAELNETKQKMADLRGENNPKSKDEMNSPLNNLPDMEPGKGNMQPNLLGDQQQLHEQKPVQTTTRTDNLVQQNTVQHEVTFTEKKTAPEKKEQDVNGIAQYTDDALSALPKELQDAVKLIQKFVADQQRMLDEANQRKNEIQATNQEENQEINERQNEQIDNRQEQNLVTENTTQQAEPQVIENTTNITNENDNNQIVAETNENNQEQVDNNAGEINENTQEQINNITQEINTNTNLLNEDNIIPAPPTDQQENNQNEIDFFQEQTAPQTEGELLNEDIAQPNVTTNNNQTVDLETLQQIFPNNPAEHGNNDTHIEAQDSAPLTDIPNPNIREQDLHFVQQGEQPTLADRLAAEQQGLDKVKNWQDTLKNVLFSHVDPNELTGFYEAVNNDPKALNRGLTGFAFATLVGETNPENKKEIMDALLSGQPLGDKHNAAINRGIANYNDAVTKLNQGNSEPMEKLLADSIRELGEQAGKEPGISLRHAMIGRLLNNALQWADKEALQLPLSEIDLVSAVGASEMSIVAHKYFQARQSLGNQQQVDLSNEQSRNAVRDLLTGKTMDHMIKQDKKDGIDVPDIQTFMGTHLMDSKSMRTLMSGSHTMTAIKPDHVQAILKNPDGFRAACVAKDAGYEILIGASNAKREMENRLELNRQNINEQEQPVINPFGVGGG